jgi:Polyketide cyclase / dehydrase and lipid transport
MMNEIAWQLEQSIETDAGPGFAWSYLTDVRNWDDPPAQFVLDGPFADGSQGTTLMPGQEPLQWRIRDVRPEQSYVIETQLERATLSFEWCFDAVSERRTRLTQRIVLSGDNATAYAEEVEASFGANLLGGMKKIATTIATAEACASSAS